MNEVPAFTIDVDQNIYLPAGGNRVDAILTVTSATDMRPAPANDVLEMIIIDVSTSMTGEKLRHAQEATITAINELREGVSFVVIAGTHGARQIFPPRRGVATADPSSRSAAAAEVRQLRAEGGTAIGAWLTLAGINADEHAGSIKHAILLTDGQNGEQEQAFAKALSAVMGKFTCDCRGVGLDWRVEELRRIASAMLGSVGIVADSAGLAADFQSIMGEAMGKSLGDVVLRLWTPRTATVRFVKQVSPTVEDLTDRRTDAGPLRGDYPIGTWGEESREYHVQIEVPPNPVGAEVLAGRASLLRRGDEQVLGQGLVRAVWTDDAALSSRIARGVAHYTGQEELAIAIQEGVAALEQGDRDTATARLGAAVKQAAASGHDGTMKLLERVVEVVDAPSGTVQLRAGASKEAVMSLDTSSTKTVRVRGGGSGGHEGEG